MKQVCLQDNFVIQSGNTEICQNEATEETRDITEPMTTPPLENSNYVDESVDSVPEDEKELEETVLRELLTVNILSTQTNKTNCPDQFNPIHLTLSITNLQLAVAVFGFICKNCSGKQGPIKDLLKLLQLCLSIDNNFAKTYAEFLKVIH